ncbi:hypothetical protein [Nocardioides sp.]|uniref:hypothetical protein n=1 Tax=Nocardioides sp. TaxID=35761 RepID=UPI0026286018|nr:hypothetical protein [Nocardioides sp.]
MTGGGAATNSGIDFQHRVGALALVVMATDIVDLSLVGLGGVEERPSEARFETADGIDDIVLIVPGGRVLIQAKNTLSLSTGEDSEFAKVIRQFVRQSRDGSSGDDRYVLAVSPGASSKIRLDLKKLCESIRLNESGRDKNPLTKNERDVLDVVNAHIDREFTSLTGAACDEGTRTALLRKMHVETLDLADGGVTERLAVTALAPVALTDPMLLWRNLVAICLGLARGRLSIDLGGLQSRVGALITMRSGEQVGGPDTPETFRIQVEQMGDVSMGREVLLVHDEELDKTILADVRRFDDSGDRRIKFVDGYVELANGVRWKVLRRTATYRGMEREIEDGLLTEDHEVIMMPGKFDDPEADPVVRAHADAFRRAVHENADFLTCLVCGRQVSEHSAYTVEIDEDTHPYEAGVVHRDCLRPTHRILGVIGSEGLAEHPLLTDFDFRTWIKQLRSGQGLFNSARDGRRLSGVTPIAWNPDNSSRETGGYGVAYDLDDGSTRYVLVRGRVHRASRAQAEREAAEMNASIERAKEAGDPFCADEHGFGNYSHMVSAETPNPPKVVSASAREITRATVAAHSTVENFYAPLVCLADRESGSMYAIGDAVVLLTDPLRLDAFLENWRQAGFDFDAPATVILAEDRDFDLFVREAEEESMIVVIDPLFDAEGNPIAGYRVTNMKSLVAKAAADGTAE